jgi:hypothetical protein
MEKLRALTFEDLDTLKTLVATEYEKGQIDIAWVCKKLTSEKLITEVTDSTGICKFKVKGIQVELMPHTGVLELELIRPFDDSGIIFYMDRETVLTVLRSIL